MRPYMVINWKFIYCLLGKYYVGPSEGQCKSYMYDAFYTWWVKGLTQCTGHIRITLESVFLDDLVAKSRACLYSNPIKF